MNQKCPECDNANVSAQAVVCLDYTDGEPALDPDDGQYAEPVNEPNNAICRHCEHPFTVAP
jgi:hypothetical protein